MLIPNYQTTRRYLRIITGKFLKYANKYEIKKYSKVRYCHMCDYRRGLNWLQELLTSYTHDSELQAITAPPLITIHK
jgi:hypothetical protein